MSQPVKGVARPGETGREGDKVNEVKLKGTLHETPGFAWVSGVKEAWIWLFVSPYWLPLLCRGEAAEAVTQCRPGTEAEATGYVEGVQTAAGWSYRIVATSFHAASPPTWQASRSTYFEYLDDFDEPPDYDNQGREYGHPNYGDDW